MFRQLDFQGDGRLSLDELSQVCTHLVPGIEKQDVAALMVKMDNGSGGGFLDYRQFIKAMVSDGRLGGAALLSQTSDPSLRVLAPLSFKG